MTKNKATPVITLKSLTKRYGIGDAEQTVLDGIDLTINKGEFIAIMGPSGCGKTTLLNILGLLDRPDEGSYHLNGKSVANLSSSRCAAIRSDKIGFVFQSFNLVPRLTVLENVALPLTYTGCPRIRSLKMASNILSTFHLNEREYYMPWQLSGGQTQRVAIARALVNNPSIILADEPTGNLDSKASHIIMEELSEIHKRGNTIIMVTHNPAMTTYADRVITMLDGSIDTDTQTRKQTSTTAVADRPKIAVHKPVTATDEKNEEDDLKTEAPSTPKKEATTKEKPTRTTDTPPVDDKKALHNGNSKEEIKETPLQSTKVNKQKPGKQSASTKSSKTSDKPTKKIPLGSHTAAAESKSSKSHSHKVDSKESPKE